MPRIQTLDLSQVYRRATGDDCDWGHWIHNVSMVSPFAPSQVVSDHRARRADVRTKQAARNSMRIWLPAFNSPDTSVERLQCFDLVRGTGPPGFKPRTCHKFTGEFLVTTATGGTGYIA